MILSDVNMMPLSIKTIIFQLFINYTCYLTLSKNRNLNAKIRVQIRVHQKSSNRAIAFSFIPSTIL